MTAKKKATTIDLVRIMANAGGVEQRRAKLMLEALQDQMVKSVGPGGTGEFTIPGMIKVQAVQMPGREQVTRSSPFNGKPMTIPARPPYTKLRVKPLKRLKDAAN